MPRQPVDSDYEHKPKTAECRGVVTVSGARLKWYDIAAAGNSVPQNVRDDAIAFLATDAAERSALQARDLGFVVLHRCGSDFYFLLLCTWRAGNELWESVYYHHEGKTDGFEPFPQPNTHKGTFCVWEMGVVAHETGAWTNFLRSPRHDIDVNGYLAAQLAGSV
jgi:hypothetical protein